MTIISRTRDKIGRAGRGNLGEEERVPCGPPVKRPHDQKQAPLRLAQIESGVQESERERGGKRLRSRNVPVTEVRFS